MQSSIKVMDFPSAQRWFYFFLCAHLLLWTIIPILVRSNLPLDSLEGAIWGHQLEWGYDKDPYLNGWLTALATFLGGYSGWMIYLFCQLSVVACFWAVWKLANQILAPIYALMAVLVLESVQYYNFHALDFNDNTLELGLWALIIYFFYQALSSSKTKDWLLTGLCAGLGLMAKYYTAILLTPLALFLLIDKTHRKQLKTAAPYYGLTVFLLLTLPHFIWLFFHDFITVNYVLKRVASEPSWLNHFSYPLQFSWEQLQVFLPALGFWLLWMLGKKPWFVREKPLSTFNKRFLIFAAFGPFLLTLLLSLCLGIKLRAGWGMPLLSLWGIAMFAFIQPRMNVVKTYGFLATLFGLMFLLLTGYSISLLNSNTPSSANFPGKVIADNITDRWHALYHQKLNYAAGSRWMGGNLEYYSKDHPAVFVNWNKQQAPWVKDSQLLQKGAVFVWNISENESLPDKVRAQFPQLSPPQILEFSYLRNNNQLAPIKIGIAFLPPS